MKSGEEAIAKVVDYFYSELVLKDDSVNHFFQDIDMEKQRRHQTKFISFALGGPNQYSGQSMAKAHEGMNLHQLILMRLRSISTMRLLILALAKQTSIRL